MKDERNLNHVNQEYTQCVARLGEMDYLSNKQFPEERELILKKVTRLQKEAKDLQSKTPQAEPTPEQTEESKAE